MLVWGRESTITDNYSIKQLFYKQLNLPSMTQAQPLLPVVHQYMIRYSNFLAAMLQ